MANKRPSRQELNRRRRRSGFVGRHGELSAFRDNLAHDPGSEAFQYLFHIHGHAGVGKTSLVRQWETAARELGAVTAYLDDDVHSVIEAMEAIGTQFGRQGAALKRFEKQLAAYHQRLHEAEAPAEPTTHAGADSAGGPGPTSSASATSTVLAHASLAGLGMLPGMGPVAGAMDPQQVAQSTDRLRSALSARFRNHTDVQLVMSPVRVLTPVFLEDLAEAAERWPWVVLFFDVFEQTSPVLNEWLRDVFVGEDYTGLPDNVLVVLSGQGRLDARYWGDYLDLLTQVPLDVFTDDEARQLLAARGVIDEHVIQIIFHLTGRLPVLVDTLAQNRPQDPSDVGDPSDTAVERFLKWITDPDQQRAALACALPLQLDEDIFRAAVPDLAADQYAWLRSLPFVSGQAGRCRYHDVVRTPMLRLQRTQSPIRWQQQHTLLANVYQQRRESLENTLPANEYWASAAWREHRLSETYHRLCARPHHTLSEALQDVLNACDEGAAVLRRWAQVLLQAGHDTDTPVLVAWEQRLQPTGPEADDAISLTNALSQLLTSSELTNADRVLAYTIRGREHRNAGRYDDALADYASALALGPDFGRAYYGRGETCRLMSRYDQALTDFNHAIELDPNDVLCLGSRAQVFRSLERYDEALVDYSRAIEIDSTEAWVILGRGYTYRLMLRYGQALADFNRAIELDPNSVFAFSIRGLTYQDLERYDEALADFARAMEIDPTARWALANRGHLYYRLGRLDEALVDFARAIEIDSVYEWAIVSRGLVYHHLERYDEALADLNRAIEIDSNYAWAIASRGQTFRSLQRYDEALVDYNRAIALDPNSEWAIAGRAQTYRALERCDEAIADYTRVIELDNKYITAITSRGEAYCHLKRYGEALADYTYAIEMEPNADWAFAGRGKTYGLMECYGEALADLNRAIELNSDYGQAIASRGQTLRDLKRYDEALADFNRAIELDSAYVWAIASRGQTYHALNRDNEALADYNRAIDLDPTADWVFAQRGWSYRRLQRYDEALADFTRAVELDPENAWFHCACGVILRLLGSSNERDRWERAEEILSRGISAGGDREVGARGDLVVLYFAMGEWAKAAEELEQFLGHVPTDSRIREALDDLKELEELLGVDATQMQSARHKLECALDRES
ncbi:tetratricopeptide repeat protein [Streptomyces mirabilis]|uniref:tetratricopeptide repeat protein n=1 Tax=Streptomyces mirabilis TaxID=68239 RepID=UPI0033F32DD8